MSFYSYKNAGNNACCPGKLQGDQNGLTERVCIQVRKVYDSCLFQQQLNDVAIALTDIQPNDVNFAAPLTFISCQSLQTEGIIRDLSIERLDDRPSFARVRANVDILLEVLFVDANGRQGKGQGIITVKRDVVLYVPCESIIPFMVQSVVSAICVSGEYTGGFNFEIAICVTMILKIVADVELLVPTYGFCTIPPCETFAENVCDEFFALPIFPPQLDCCE